MDSVKYVKRAVQTILDAFPGSSIRYEHKEEFEIHLLKVFPENVGQTPEFCEVRDTFVDSFLDEFPGESVAFLSKNSTVKIENPTEIFYGRDFFLEIRVTMAKLKGELEAYFNQQSLKSASITVSNFSPAQVKTKPSKKEVLDEETYAMAA